MNILKILGIVAGIHVVAFFLMFVNPGCRSTSAAPSRADTLPAAAPAPSTASAATAPSDPGTGTAPAVSLNIPSSSPRYAPTRPGSPASEALETAPVSDVTPASTYSVVRGDSLSKIAKKNHTTQAELMKANHLTSNSVLSVGQKLIIPGKAAAAGSAPVAAEAAHSSSAPAESAHSSAPATPLGPTSVKTPQGAVTHEVKAGETIGAIARKYHVKTQDLLVANNIADPGKIRAGQVLVIPGASASGRSSASAASSPAARPSQAVKPSPAAPASPAPATAKADTSATTPPANNSDLDSGGKPQGDVPVIKVDDSSDNKTP
jgi:LysM repeat protein